MKFLKILLCTVVLLALLATVGASAFSDVATGSWYCHAVNYLADMGVVDGYADGRFGPDDTLEAAQFLKIVALTFYPEEIPLAAEGETWGDRYYKAALNHGVITDNLVPSDQLYEQINRYQVADVVEKLLGGVMGESVTTEAGTAARVADYAEIPEQYRPAVEAVYSSGIIGGCNAAGSFGGEAPLTRAQAAQIILRMVSPDDRLNAKPKPEATPQVTPKPNKVEDEWFSNTLFLGDSLTHGLSLYGDLKTPTYCFYTGLSVYNAGEKTLECSDGVKRTLDTALKQKNWERVYIMLGINELGSDLSGYIKSYGTLIDTIRAALPNAEICIQTLLPVSRAKEAKGGSFTLAAVRERNEALTELAHDKSCLLVDTNKALADDNGYLPAAYTWDGVHLNSEYYKLWAEWLRTHTGD